MASTSRKTRTLDDGQRAEFFLGLARTLSAGLDAQRALKAMHGICDRQLDAALTRAAQAIGKGSALLLALQRVGLISDRDQALLAMAESNGALEQACERLAQRYQRAEARWRQLKGKLLLPATVLVMAIILLPLPALFAGTLGIGTYVMRAVGLLLLLAIFVQMLAGRIKYWRAHSTSAWMTRLARALPILGPMSVLHQRAAVNEQLALALRCGAPAADALQMMLRAERNSLRQHTLAALRKDLVAGASLATALQGQRLLDGGEFAVVSAGEAAGRIDDSLHRISASLHDALDARYALIAQWLPVILYLCVAGIVLFGLL